MEKILFNLALIDLINYCKQNNMDCSGTHCVKNGRGFKYSLVRDNDGLAIVSVAFNKSAVPTHSINK